MRLPRRKREICRAVASTCETLELRRLLSTVYVDASSHGGNNGADWADAYTSLQSALTTANPGETIEVGQGTYYPSATGDPSATFSLPNDVTVEGGFAGVGTANPDARNVTAYPTILSGDIGATPSYVVVTASNDGSATVLDGFTITGGDSVSAPDQEPGGMLIEYSSMVVNDCTFSGDSGVDGGGMEIMDNSNRPNYAMVSNCTFTGDSATYGGAVYVEFSEPTLSDCTMNDNTATSDGGAVYDDQGSTTLTDCTIDGDSATDKGGGVYAYYSIQVSMTDCTLDGDSAGISGGAFGSDIGTATLVQCAMSGDQATNFGGAIYSIQGSTTVINSTVAGDTAGSYSAIDTVDIGGVTALENCIIWGDGPANADEINSNQTTATYCDIDQSFNEQPFPGQGNIFGNPFFVRSPGADGPSDYGDLQLQGDSYAIDKGSIALVPITITSDLAGGPRFYNGAVDMGAYEYAPNTNLPDLSPSNVNTGAPSVNFGQSVSIFWTDNNLGPASAPEGYVDRIYLSTTPDISASSVLLLQITPGSGIGSGGSVAYGTSVTMPDQTRSFGPGTYYLVVRDNATWNVSELSDSNNDASTSIQITHAPVTYYVDADTPAASANQTGSSWSTAFATVQQGLSAAFAGDTIQVAQGTYYPSYTDDSTQSFDLINGVTMEGGFGGNLLASHGGNPNTRNVAAYPSILSGLIDGGSTTGTQSYQVVFADDVSPSTVFDGFTVTGGDNDFPGASGTPATGGGMYLYVASPTINDCTFTANSSFYGAGLEVADSSNPTISNCTFLNNARGSGLECDQGSSPAITDCTFNESTETALNDVQNCDPTLTDCTFIDTAQGGDPGCVVGFRSDPTLLDCTFLGTRGPDGGAVDDDFSSAILINCLIDGDGATANGGAIYSYQGTLSVTNCTIVNCTAGNAFGAISASDSTVTVSNCIIYGDGPNPISSNVPVTYSDVQGGFTGAGNLNATPDFVATNNFQLQAGSPCINAGDNADVPSGVTTDLAGNPRIVGGTVDMGAYEYQVTAVTWTGTADGINWGVAGNWSDGQVPTSTTSVIIPTGDDPHIGSSTFSIASIMLQGTATVDVGAGKLFIDYGSTADPITTIVSYLTSGYDAGKWKGTGITSSAVANEDSTQTALIYDVAYADGADGLISGLNSGSIEIMPTLAGDAKLQGNVVFGDFQVLAQYFGKSGGWDKGDFNYGGSVVFGDFQLLAQNFGKTSSLSGSETASNPIISAASTPAASDGSDPDSILDGAVDSGDASPFSDLLLDS